MNNATTTLTELAQLVTRGAATERERAVAIHDFVRDNVRYGFTSRFDEATPLETLEAGLGHCNAQAKVFVEMLRAVGIEARYHFVTLDGEILRGVLQSPPAVISHGFSEVKVEGRWLKVDSYVVDPQHAAGAAARLSREGRRVGYGFHIDGTVEWDGASDAFSQLADRSMILEDHGAWDSADDFFRSSSFKHRLGPISFSAMLSAVPSLLFRSWSSFVDWRLDRVRAEAVVPAASTSVPSSAPAFGLSALPAAA